MDSEVEHRAKQQRVEKQLYTDVGRPSTIKFSTEYLKRDLRLLEVPPELINAVKNGESLSIIGDGKEEVVLCSSQNTYSVKKVETSNSVFLVLPSAGDTFDIEHLSREFYEVKPTKPRVEMVETLLKPWVYNGSGDEVGSLAGGLTRNDLRVKVQASEKELNDALYDMGAVEIDGIMRMLSKSALLEIMQNMFDTIIENGWFLQGLRQDLLAAALPDTCAAVMDYVLSKLGSKDEASAVDSETWSLDLNTILKYSAHIVFNSQVHSKKKWPASDFFMNWQLKSPGIKASTNMKKYTDLLRGIATLNPDGESFCYFRADELSQNIEKRFTELFAKQSKYTQEQFEGYLDGFYGVAGKSSSMVELLLQHARFIDGYYMAK